MSAGLGRYPVAHEMKTRRGPFAALWTGSKRHEYRRDDRPDGFQVLDSLHLVEVGDDDVPTGRWVRAIVTYIGRHGGSEQFAGVEVKNPIDFGIPEGYVVMSILETERHDPTEKAVFG